MSKVWVLDIGNGVERAFSSLEKAYNAAYDQLVNWGYNPDDEAEKLLFEELKSTYENQNYSGFSVVEVLCCWAISLD